MVANQDEVRQLADACVLVSTNTRNSEAAAELLRISHRLLQLSEFAVPLRERDPTASNCQQEAGSRAKPAVAACFGV
jgi:hypothetical protein